MNSAVHSPRVGRLLDSAVLAGERSAPAILAVVIALYVAATCGRASQKLLWHDELFTLHMSRLPVSDLWAAIATPSDATPPLFHLITRIPLAIAGEGLIAIRLPAIAGFLIAMLCLYAFVGRRYGRVYGVVAAVLPIATHAYTFAYEARAYGVVLGFTALSLLAWQAAADGRRRAVSLPLLLTSLAIAISCHYYAVLALVPLSVGEAVRFWSRRKPDWPMWAVLIVATSPLAVLSPLVRSARLIAAGWFSVVTPRVIFETYEEALTPLAVPALVALVLCCLAVIGGPKEPLAEEPDRTTGAPLHEWAAVLVLLATPIWATTVAGLVIGSFVPRYALLWIIGFSIAVAFVLAAMCSRPRVVGTIVMLTLAGWTGLRGASSVRLLAAPPPTIESNHAALFTIGTDARPIVVSHAHLYLPLAEYAPRELGRRLVLLTLPQRVVAWFGESGDRAMIGLANWTPLNVQDFDAFAAGRRPFLLYGPPLWITKELHTAGARLTLRGEDHYAPPFAMSRPECVFLYEVTFD